MEVVEVMKVMAVMEVMEVMEFVSVGQNGNLMSRSSSQETP